MMKNPESKRPVTVEDLLRLKRAERPPAEFWTRFEQELRAKQLAAIVAKKPWWRTAPHFLTDWTRYRLPVGAAAILAVTFVSVRSFQSSTPPAQFTSAAAESASEVAVATTPTAEVPPVAAQVIVASVPPAEASASLVAASDAPLDTEGTPSASTAQSTSSFVSAETSSFVSAETAEIKGPSPTAEAMAANLAVLKETHPELVGRYLGAGGFEKRGMPERKQAVDPLTQMKGPADLHRERLLSAGFPTATATAATMRTGERIARRISSDRLREELGGRFVAAGNSLGVKF
jgi:hypothetical protein